MNCEKIDDIMAEVTYIKKRRKEVQKLEEKCGRQWTDYAHIHTEETGCTKRGRGF